MDVAIKAKNHFVLETPLSHPDYWKYIDRFENNGYQVAKIICALIKLATVRQGATKGDGGRPSR
jgi:predicted ABC-type ATPase